MATKGKIIDSEGQGKIKLLYKGLIPVLLVVAGVVILVLGIEGWSVLLGIPITVIGVIMMIYTYDEMVQKRVKPFPEKFDDMDENSGRNI